MKKKTLYKFVEVEQACLYLINKGLEKKYKIYYLDLYKRKNYITINEIIQNCKLIIEDYKKCKFNYHSVYVWNQIYKELKRVGERLDDISHLYLKHR